MAYGSNFDFLSHNRVKRIQLLFILTISNLKINISISSFEWWTGDQQWNIIVGDPRLVRHNTTYFEGILANVAAISSLYDSTWSIRLYHDLDRDSLWMAKLCKMENTSQFSSGWKGRCFSKNQGAKSCFFLAQHFPKPPKLIPTSA